jgi:antitoxin component of MazEF toxin-antitoxin module
MQLFTAGLQPPLSLNVEIHNPQSLAITMSFTRKMELRDQCAGASAP